MAITIDKLKGVTDALLGKIKEKGINDTDQLLEAAAGPADRKALSAHCGCETRVILELANRADLSRVSGVAGVYSDLLEQAGVDTVKELATRKPENLRAKIIKTNESAALTKQPPSLSQVENWVQQAKDLPKLLSY